MEVDVIDDPLAFPAEFRVMARSRDQMDDLYRELSGHERVKVVL